MSNDYLRPKDILIKYSITAVTLNKWIKDAQNKKNGLELKAINKKYRILNNPHNLLVLDDLKSKSQKYRNKVTKKTYQVGDSFYSSFNHHERIEVYKSLGLKKEINLKYFYKNSGAKYCDSYYQSKNNYIKDKVNSLLDNSIDDLNYYTGGKHFLNLIDLGPGNGYPAKEILDSSLSKRIKKYIAVDISQSINEIALNNINTWYPKLPTQSYIRDFEYDKFGDVFIEHKDISRDEANIILFLGSTLNNSDDRVTILKNIAGGMLEDDILVSSVTLDNDKNRVKNKYIKNEDLAKQSEWLFALLGIDQDDKRINVDFNPLQNMNYKYLQIDKDYSITFSIENQDVTVDLFKDDKINFWKHYLLSKDTLSIEATRAGLEIIGYKQDVTDQIALVTYKLIV